MIAVALYQPEIPPNTGNLIRLCANSGATLHLIRPLGFQMDNRRLRRAGLDYDELATLVEHEDYPRFQAAIGSRRLLAFSTRGTTRYDQVAYRADDVLLFGPETRGLPQALLDPLTEAQRLYLPMRTGSRSLNLANAASVAVYEAWRQLNFNGAG